MPSFSAHKGHGVHLVAEPYFFEIVITRLILAQGIGKVFINIFVAGIDNNLGKEHAGGRTIYRNLNHGVVEIIVAIHGLGSSKL